MPYTYLRSRRLAFGNQRLGTAVAGRVETVPDGQRLAHRRWLVAGALVGHRGMETARVRCAQVVGFHRRIRRVPALAAFRSCVGAGRARLACELCQPLRRALT